MIGVVCSFERAMEKSLILLFLGLFILSAGLNFLLLRWTRTLGRKNEVNSNEIRWSDDYKPAIGGISFFIIFLIAYLAYFILYKPVSDASITTEIGIITAVALGFFTGLVDDAFNTVPWLKFAAQLTCGAVFLLSDIYINFFGIYLLDAPLTIFWTAAVMNSLNMLDNMDGIATLTTISILVAAGLCALPLNISSIFFTLVCGGTVAALLGFMIFNWHPAKMFMGDTGSQLLGALLAGVGIIFFWNNENLIVGHHWYSKIAIVLVAFVIPIGDSLTVTINRMMRGQSPFVGGRDHTTHHLSYAGLSDNKVALVYIVISIVSLALISVLNTLGEEYLLVITAAFYTFSILTIGFLYSTTQWRKPKEIFQSTIIKSNS